MIGKYCIGSVENPNTVTSKVSCVPVAPDYRMLVPGMQAEVRSARHMGTRFF